MVASLPVLVKRTTSADGTIRRKRSAASTSAEVAAAKCEPSAIAAETVFDPTLDEHALNEGAERHHEVDILIAIRIPYVRPLAAFQHDRAGVYTVAPREGEFTALDQRLLCAFEHHCCERVRLRSGWVCAHVN